MLRLPKFAMERPTRVDQVVALLQQHGERCKLLAGGTDLVPNMKHGLFEPDVVVSLAGVEELRGIQRQPDGVLAIGAMTTLEEVEQSDLVRGHAPGLCQAARAVAGPSQRTMATLGGNVCLDTRCVWYNQTFFWRQSLGFCLKKDGTVCHVVESGSKCVAAASNDAGTMLVALDATLEIVSAAGTRTVPIREFYHPDGAYNLRLGTTELLTRIRLPTLPVGHHSGYAKLRPRQSIDFPKLSVAATYALDDGGVMADAALVVSALAATPRRIQGLEDVARGRKPDDHDFLADAGDLAFRRCRALTNIDGDADYRRDMVPVYVKRAFQAAQAAAVAED